MVHIHVNWGHVDDFEPQIYRKTRKLRKLFQFLASFQLMLHYIWPLTNKIWKKAKCFHMWRNLSWCSQDVLCIALLDRWMSFHEGNCWKVAWFFMKWSRFCTYTLKQNFNFGPKNLLKLRKIGFIDQLMRRYTRKFPKNDAEEWTKSSVRPNCMFFWTLRLKDKEDEWQWQSRKYY